MKRTDTSSIRAGKEKILEAGKLTNWEARCLIANYYQAQELRKRADMQLRHRGDKDDPVSMLDYFGDAQADIDIARAPTAGHIWRFAGLDPSCVWYSREEAERLVKQHSSGKPDEATVLAICEKTGKKFANLMRQATRDHKGDPIALTAGSLIKALSLRPFNPHLKQVCYHAGLGFMRFSNNPNSIYGSLYRAQKARVVARNERGDNTERAR